MAATDASSAKARARTILSQIDLGDWSPAGSHIIESTASIYSDGYRRALRLVGYRTGAETINQARANLGRKPVAHGDVSPFGRPRQISRASALRKDLFADETAAQIGISLDQVNELALAWAEEHAADLVTDISDATRDMLLSTVTDAIENGWSAADLATAVADSVGFSDARAETIARTELITAYNQSALDAYKSSGVVDGKSWLSAGDDLVEEDCEMNEEDGVIPLDDDFSSGDDAPPAHPNCRCAIIAEFLDEE